MRASHFGTSVAPHIWEPATNRMIRLTLSIAFGVVALTAIAVRADSITAKGSDTLVILAQKWAEVYMAEHPNTKIQVTGGGSGTGFAALQNHTTDLCNASRPIKSKEVLACIKVFRKRPTEYKVALDGLSVYVNESNPVRSLTVAQLKDIFTGRTENWKEVGGEDAPIVLYSRENSSGTYEFFKQSILDGADYSARAQTMPGTAAVLQAVGKDTNGIGYGGVAYGSGARALPVSKAAGLPAIAPTEENVVNGSYPIWRYLYIYVNPALDTGEIAHYLNWIRSDAGQDIVKNVGYFPLPKASRN